MAFSFFEGRSWEGKILIELPGFHEIPVGLSNKTYIEKFSFAFTFRGFDF